jgi:hypothetical protein
MADIQKTNVCCLDLTKECIDYLQSMDLDVYEGSLGSVFSIKWVHNLNSGRTVLLDVDIPVNLHEYHVFIHDMENPQHREYNSDDHKVKDISSTDSRHLECFHPINTLDLRPFGLNRLNSRFREECSHKRIEIIFVGRENEVTYQSNDNTGYDSRTVGTFSNIDGWNFVNGKEKLGKRVRCVDNWASKTLFEGRINNVKYYREFFLPTKYDGEERVVDEDFLPLLCNEEGGCVSYVYTDSENYAMFVLPQVDDKAGLLKELFEKIIFRYFSEYFPDIEARNWIHGENYLMPDELEIQRRIEAKREELENEIEKLEQDASIIREQNNYLKQLLTESGGNLVTAVKTFLEWLGFENVIDKDDTLKEGDLKEEDLCFDYEGTHVIVGVKGINGTSTDKECAQIDKIVSRRMRQLKTTDVHGIYIVNNQRNVEPLKRMTPPFNDNQINDAKGECRTMVYSTQLFALYSDIENGYLSKESARSCFMQLGLVDFHVGLTSLGVPYNYHHDETVICLELNGVEVSVGDLIFYRDPLNRLVGCKVESIELDKEPLDSASSGRVGIKVDHKVPRNKELFL